MLHVDRYVVFEGNRRVTCMKLLRNPNEAPNDELRQFFQDSRNDWEGRFPSRIACQVETDRDTVDDILSRRHTGSQSGVGQISWDDRAKHNFVQRTGRGGTVNVGASVEQLLQQEDRLPDDRIPWSTLTRLLSSEEFRNRVGISTAGRRFTFTHQREPVLNALERIARDLAQGHLTLGQLWNNESKRRYLDNLEADGLLPTERHRLEEPVDEQRARRPNRGRPPRRQPPSRTVIPFGTEGPQWTADQQKVAHVWDELSSIPMRSYPNATAALLRMLIELSVENYIRSHGLQAPDSLSGKVGAVARSLRERDLIDQRYSEEIERLRRNDELISIASMQRLLHSPDFAPLEHEFRAYWSRLGRFLLAALSR
ncbi:hypothetical protein Ga0102493_112143 [Erythrobacter litoralis]|nr:hypothetical protein Ga0102493_112143 [Erythrobacter litoralis]